MCRSNTFLKALKLKPVLDIYLTIEACSNILCNLHISKSWLFFRLATAFYATILFGYSIFYWHYDGKLKYFMAFFTNWVFIVQYVYFLFSSYMTYKIFQEIQPKFEESRSNQVRHNVSQGFDIDIVLSNLSVPVQHDIDIDATYDIVGQPPHLKNLGYRNMFLFTKSLLEFSLPYSFAVCVMYWSSIYSGHFEDTQQALYYINTHGIIFMLQFIDYYASTYQLRFIYGSLWILIFAVILFVWMWLFEELKFVNPWTKKNQLYAICDLHNDAIKSTFMFCIGITFIILLYWFIVFTKNISLIKWKQSKQADNKHLSADNSDLDFSDVTP